VRVLLATVVLLAAVPAAASPAPSEAQRAATSRCQDVFRPLDPARSGRDPTSIAPGDFNADGRPDLAVGRRVGSGLKRTALTVLLGDGDGRFRAPAPLMPIAQPGDGAGEFGAPLVAEFTGDAHIDLLIVPQDRPGITLLAGDGSGRFTRRDQPFGFGQYARARAVADLNGDRHADVIVDAPRAGAPGAGFGSNLHVLLGDGAGSFAEAQGGPVALTGPLMDLAVGEFNRDGHVDLAAGLNYGDDALPILLGDGRGGFQPVSGAVRWRGSTGGVRSFGLLRAGDVDADGTTDLVAVLQGTPDFHVLLGDGSGHFSDRVVKRSGNPVASIAVGDFNRDRFADVAVSSYTSSEELGNVNVFLSVGDGDVYEAPGSPEQPGSILFGLTAADLDADGYDDLAMLDVPGSGTGNVPVLLNTAGRSRRSDRVPIRNGRLTPPVAAVSVPFRRRVQLAAFIVCEPGARKGRRLSLRRRVATHAGTYGPWRRLATKTSDRGGSVSVADRPPAIAQYRWVPADRRRPALKSAPPVTVRVEQTVSVRRAGRRLRGRVRPAHPGAVVVLQRSNEQGQDEEEWTVVARARLTGASSFSLPAPRRRGLYRVCRAADRAHASGVSPDIRRRPGSTFVERPLRSRAAAAPTRCIGPNDA
jgi:FG-GAP-like repeat/FG-GAP repeat